MLGRLAPFAAALLVLAAPAAASLDWAQPGGDAGRSGAQPVDPGREPVGLLWGADDVVRTPVTISAGASPADQRVVYGVTGSGPVAFARVVVRTLERPGVLLGTSTSGTPIDETPGDTNAFGTNGAVGIVSGVAGLAFAVHNDNGHVEVARVRLDGTADAREEHVLASSSGCSADASPLLAAAALFVVTGGPGACAALWRIPVDAAGDLVHEPPVTVAGVNPLAAPALANVRDAGGTARPYVLVAADGQVRLFAADAPQQAPIVVALPAGDDPQSVLVPATVAGEPPSAAPAVFVAAASAGGTRVHRLVPSGGGLAVDGTSELIPGLPAPAMAAQPLDEAGEASGSLVVTTAQGAFLVTQPGLVARKVRNGAHSRTTATISGALAYLQSDDGSAAVLRLPSGDALESAFFDAPDATGAAWGQPAVARGFVAFADSAGAHVYRNTDATPPSVTLVSPGADASLRGVASFRARAGDARGVARVEFRLAAPGGVARTLGSDEAPDSGQAFDPVAAASWSADVQTASVPNGTYVVDALAIDSSGNRGESVRWTVRINNLGGGGGGLPPGRCANALTGGDGPDLLTGTAAGDLLRGGSGDDRLSGANGADCLFGEAGADRLAGGAGHDDLDGGPGNDVLDGGSGRDGLLGGAGADVLRGATGNDTLSGGFGRDDLRGGRNEDRLLGGSGGDSLRGESGRDRLVGGTGNDVLVGGPGVDGLDGGSGNDRIDSRDKSRDAVSCGRGRDQVRADRRDRVSSNCERVSGRSR